MSAFLCGRRLGKNGTFGQAKIAAHHYEEPWESAKRFLHRLICLSFGSSLDGQCREGVALGDDGCLTILRAERLVLLVPDELDSLEAHRVVVALEGQSGSPPRRSQESYVSAAAIADSIMAVNPHLSPWTTCELHLAMRRQLKMPRNTGTIARHERTPT
jgi:hypothetical protein